MIPVPRPMELDKKLRDNPANLFPRRGFSRKKKRKKKSRQEDFDFWGNSWKIKHINTFRFALYNINGLPTDAKSSVHMKIIDTINKRQINYLGLLEHNNNLNVLNHHNQWKDKFRRSRTNKHAAWNVHSKSRNKILAGGTGYITNKETSHKIQKFGEDGSGLGRWVWATIDGKGTHKSCLISGCRPCEDKTDRPGTVCTQHEVVLKQKKDYQKSSISDSSLIK